MGDFTFTIVKPDAVKAGHTGKIIDRILQGGFSLVAMKLLSMNRETAARFYAIHEGKPFFEELIDFMSSGSVVVAVLKKENAVQDFRTLIGATHPEQAAPGTIRKDFAKSLGENAIHGSDSDANAKIESDFFFSEIEKVYV